MIPAEAVRYRFRSRLVDQFITVGPPPVEVSDFRLKGYWSEMLGSKPNLALGEADDFPLKE